MEEKILDLIKNSGRSLTILEIVEILYGSSTPENIKEVSVLLNKLLHDGHIKYNNKKQKYSMDENKVRGKIQIIDSGTGFVLLDGADLMIPSNLTNGARDGDTVLAEIIKTREGSRQRGRVIKVIERSLGKNVGEVYLKDGELMVKLLNNNSKKAMRLYVKDADTNFVEGEIVKIEMLKEITPTDYLVKITEKIGHKNDPDTDTKSVAAEFNIPVEFNEETIGEARELYNHVLENEKINRVDLRKNRRIFTIDGSDTKDIDDAISYEELPNGNIEIGIHIADVSHYVKPGSYLFESAMERGNSYYMADKVFPMLPKELSNGICSLHSIAEGDSLEYKYDPDFDRLTLSCLVEMTKDGNIVGSQLYESIINSKKKMTYEEVNKLLDGNPSDDYKEFESDLNNLYNVSQLLEKKAMGRGKLNFDSLELKFKMNDRNKVLEIKRYETGKGQKLIENLMILANTEVAKKAKKTENCPFVYRNHDKPSPEKVKNFLKYLSVMGHTIKGKFNFDNMTPLDFQSILNQLEDSDDYAVASKLALRCMAKAKYEPSNIGHFGLGEKIYCHFTSPIRRASDLLVHLFLKECVINGNSRRSFYGKWEEELKTICPHISFTEVNSEDAEYAVNDMKIAEYMEGVKDMEDMPGHIHEEYEAIIDGITKNKIFVIAGEVVNGFISVESLKEKLSYDEELMALTSGNNIVYKLGDKIIVECIRASKLQREVEFARVLEKKYGNN